jgi:hypothetical protein
MEIIKMVFSDWSPDDMEIFQHPMCLISSESVENEEGEEINILLKSEQAAFAQIKKIDWPIVVVAVVGLYRTGKSYLMNRLAQSSKGKTIFIYHNMEEISFICIYIVRTNIKAVQTMVHSCGEKNP